MAKTKKTAAQRRAQAKRAAARDDLPVPGSARDDTQVDAAPPSLTAPAHTSAPPPSTAELHAPVTASAPLQHRPARAPASSPAPLLPPSTRPFPAGAARPPPPPRSRPRDLLVLASETGASAHPWWSVRRRRQRRARPHRHERQQRAFLQAQHERLMWDRYHQEEALVDDLRDACYIALGPLYQSDDVHVYGHCTPVPADRDFDRSIFRHRDEGECFSEILTAVVEGDEVLSDAPHTPQQRRALAVELADCLTRLQPSVWDALLTAHSFFACTEAHWHEQRLPDLQRCYLAGMHSWFFCDGG